MAGAHRHPRRGRRGLRAVLVVLAAVLGLAPAGSAATRAAFSAVTANSGNVLAADQLAAPSDLVAAQICPATAAVAFRAWSSATGSISIVLAPPSGTQPGDLMLAQVANRYGAMTITAPTGWTRVRTDTSGGQVTSAVYWKVAVNNEPPAVFSRPSGSSGDMVGIVVAYSGVDPGSPIAAEGSATGATATATTPTLTTTATDVRVVHFLTKRQEQLPAPTGTTGRRTLISGNGTDTEGITAADEPFAGPGTTPPHTSASPSNFTAEWIAQAVVLRRVGGGSPSAALTWTASPSTRATGYHLERIGGTAQATRTLTGVSTTSTTDGPLTNGTTYTYRLSAYRGTWTSPAVTATLTPGC